MKAISKLGLLVMLANMSACWSRADTIAVMPESSQLMPNGFTNLYFGMPIENFLRARPRAKRDEWLKEASLLTGRDYYDEQFLGGSWTLGRFVLIFDQLREVSLVRSLKFDDESLFEKRSTFLSGCVQKWGTNCTLHVRSSQNFQMPLLRWERDGVKIFVTLPPDRIEDPERPIFFQVVLADINNTRADEIVATLSLDAASVSEFFRSKAAAVLRLIGR